MQKVPALLDEVHSLIKSKGLRFILSGSSARKLKRGRANLLAGRARVERMFPLVSAELGAAFDSDKALEHGLLPGAVLGADPTEFLSAYAETYLREEIQSEALIRNLGGFARFLEIAARHNGQVTNIANIARDAHVARQTVQGYFEVLQDTLIGYFLEAWKLKRATKQIAHPKFYLSDAGVARVLSGRIAYALSPEEMGFQFETLMLHEVRAFLAYRKLRYPISFWSSHDGVEVDLILEDPKGLLAIEFKSATRWERKYGSGLHRLRDEIKGIRTLDVFRGPRSMTSEGLEVLAVRDFLTRLWDGALVR